MCSRLGIVASVAAVGLVAMACGGSRTYVRRTRSPAAMATTPAGALALCQEIGVMRPACPTLVPKSNAPPRRGDVGAECTDNNRSVSRTSKRCRDAEWSYIAGGGTPPGVPSAKTVEWTEPPGPPWFVHVDITAAQDSSPCAWPQEGSARELTDRLIGQTRTHALSLGDVTWSGKHGQLVLAPGYPSGGEVGGHLEFCYGADGVHYAVTLHAWSSVFRFTVDGVRKTLVLRSGPSSPSVVAALRSIVSSAPHS